MPYCVGQLLEVAVVRHDRRDVDLQRAGAPAKQQVVEAVAELRHHDQGPVRRAGRPQLPGHREALGDARRTRARRSSSVAPAVGHLEMHPQEEPAGVGVAVLLALDDVAGVLDQESGDRVHDAGPVGAAQAEHEVVAGRRSIMGSMTSGLVDIELAGRSCCLSRFMHYRLAMSNTAVGKVTRFGRRQHGPVGRPRDRRSWRSWPAAARSA